MRLSLYTAMAAAASCAAFTSALQLSFAEHDERYEQLLAQVEEEAEIGATEFAFNEYEAPTMLAQQKSKKSKKAKKPAQNAAQPETGKPNNNENLNRMMNKVEKDSKTTATHKMEKAQKAFVKAKKNKEKTDEKNNVARVRDDDDKRAEMDRALGREPKKEGQKETKLK